MHPNAYDCPECAAEVEAADARSCPECGVWLVLEPDGETVCVGESVKVRDLTRWIVKEPPCIARA